MQGEYVGELLSQEECERRGQVYDIINSSYLFQLNAEWAIDARKAGSKLRCALFSRFVVCHTLQYWQQAPLLFSSVDYAAQLLVTARC